MREDESKMRRIGPENRNDVRLKEYPVKLGNLQAFYFYAFVTKAIDDLTGPRTQEERANRESLFRKLGEDSTLVGIERKLGSALGPVPTHLKSLTFYEIEVALSAIEVDSIAWAFLRKSQLMDYVMFNVPLRPAVTEEVKMGRRNVVNGLKHLLDLFNEFTESGGPDSLAMVLITQQALAKVGSG